LDAVVSPRDVAYPRQIWTALATTPLFRNHSHQADRHGAVAIARQTVLAAQPREAIERLKTEMTDAERRFMNQVFSELGV